MATPRAVQRQAAEAERLLKEAQKPAEEPKEAQEPEAQPEQPQPEAQPEGKVEELKPAPKAEPAPEPKKPETDPWEERYKALRGKYDKEVPRLNEEVRTANERLRALEEAMAAMKSSPQPAPSTPDKATSTKTLVTAEEIDEYGEDFVDLMRRIANETIASRIEELTPRLSKLEAGFTQTKQQTAQQRVHAALDSQVENWRDINRDPLFGEWLKEFDLASGRSRGELMNEAYSAGQPDRVVYFFKEYAKTLPETAVQSHTGSPGAAAPKAPASGVTLENLAGPPQRHPGNAPASPEQPRTISRAEIASFYADVQKGLYRNRVEEKVKKEAEFHRAAAEGRVV